MMRNPIRPLIEWIFFKIWPKSYSSVDCINFEDFRSKLSSLVDDESELKKTRFKSLGSFFRWWGVTGRAYRGTITDKTFTFYDRRSINPDGSQIEGIYNDDENGKVNLTVRAKKSTIDNFALVFYVYAGITLLATIPAVLTLQISALVLPAFFALLGTIYLCGMYTLGWMLDSRARQQLLNLVTGLCAGKEIGALTKKKFQLDFVFTLIPVALIGLWCASGFHTEVPFPMTMDPLVINGWVFEKFFIPRNYFETVNVPQGTKVTMDGKHQIELIVRKSVSYAGHPLSFMSLGTESPKLGCAVRAEGKILRVTTYGGWNSFEGGVESRIVHVKLPPGMKVSYDMDNRPSTGVNFKILMRRLKDKAGESSAVPEGWQKLEPVPFWYMELF